MSSVKNTASEISEALASGFAQLAELGALLKRLQKAVGAKKTRAPGSGSAWTDWTSQAKTLFPDEYAEHLAGLPLKPATKEHPEGAPVTHDIMGFAQKCRASLHVAEWTAFESKWKAEHPKAEKVKAPKGAKAAKAVEASSEEEEGYSSSASKASGLPKATPPPKAKAKAVKAKKAEKAEAEPEAKPEPEKAEKPEKAKAKAEKAAKPKSAKAEKAEKGAAAAKAAAEAAKADPPVPWEDKGKKYLKNDKGQVWTVGADGSVGEWYGTHDGKKILKSEGPATE